MQIHMIAVGNAMPGWVNTGVETFSRRMPRECALTVREVRPVKGRKGDSAAVRVKSESKRVLDAIPPGSEAVALEVTGQIWSSEELARRLSGWLACGRNLAFLIGGADGLSKECLDRSACQWSLSRLTLPHALVRVIVAEQCYRAWSILQNHPYHRGDN